MSASRSRRVTNAALDIIGIKSGICGDTMADFVLRNLDDDLKEKLRLSAARNRRSMNAELREIVRVALTQPRRTDRTELKQLAAEIRALSAERQQTPSEDLLRESRDER